MSTASDNLTSLQSRFSHLGGQGKLDGLILDQQVGMLNEEDEANLLKLQELQQGIRDAEQAGALPIINAITGRGWIIPGGGFFEVPSPMTTEDEFIPAGHAGGGMDWLEQNRPELHSELEALVFRHNVHSRTSGGAYSLIRGFMERHGFVHVSGSADHLSLSGDPTQEQIDFAIQCAKANGGELYLNEDGGRRLLYSALTGGA